jgi:hypothetical protein
MLATWLLVAIALATLGVTVAILAVLVRRLRRSRPSPLPAPPPPRPARRVAPPPASPLPSLDAAWGGVYDDTRPDPIEVPLAPTRLYDPEATTLRPADLLPPLPRSEAATTVQTSHSELARALEAEAERRAPAYPPRWPVPRREDTKK